MHGMLECCERRRWTTHSRCASLSWDVAWALPVWRSLLRAEIRCASHSLMETQARVLCMWSSSNSGRSPTCLSCCDVDSAVWLIHRERRSRRNAAENKLTTTVATCELSWGGDVAEACAAIGGAPHLIIAADVIYREQTFAPLVSTLTQLCDASSEKAEVLLAYRPRVADSHFWHMVHVEFTATTVGPPVELMQHFRGGAHGQVTGSAASGSSGTATRIYRLRRRSARQPTTCRDCQLRQSAAVAAVAAIAKAGKGLAARPTA
mmetsp:Transcript_67976/g.134742  ORF Transcript_67976/g.134742 Transcript_67976/m.134742 type:complete len:263 (+) Transcript_67976:585-1373(+)